jgi:hypothetical protein
MGKIRPRRLEVLGAAALALLLAVPLAAATEISREEYVAAVEPICKANVEANKRIFRGARPEVKAGELKRASKHFFRAARAFAATIARIEAVPRPHADKAKLARWFGHLRAEQGLIGRVGRALAAGDKHKAGSYSIDLNHNSNLANNTVLGFGFDYCRIDPSRFSAA